MGSGSIAGLGTKARIGMRKGWSLWFRWVGANALALVWLASRAGKKE